MPLITLQCTVYLPTHSCPIVCNIAKDTIMRQKKHKHKKAQSTKTSSQIQNRLRHDISVRGWADCWIISGAFFLFRGDHAVKGDSEFKVTPLRFWWWQWYLSCGVMVIIFSVCPVPDKRHLMTKMSSTLRRSENCRRGRKAEFPLRVLLVTFIARSSQLFAHPLARRRLHWTLFNTRSSPLCIAIQQISTRLDSKT